MNKIKLSMLIVSLLTVAVFTLSLFSQNLQDDFVMLGKILLAFFPVLLALFWFHERDNYLR